MSTTKILSAVIVINMMTSLCYYDFCKEIVFPLHSFTFISQEGVSVLDPGAFRSDTVVSLCIRPDVRLDTNADCSAYMDTERAVSAAFLYPPGLSVLHLYKSNQYSVGLTWVNFKVVFQRGHC